MVLRAVLMLYFRSSIFTSSAVIPDDPRLGAGEGACIGIKFLVLFRFPRRNAPLALLPSSFQCPITPSQASKSLMCTGLIKYELLDF